MDIEDTRKLESLTAEELEHVSLGLMRNFGFRLERFDFLGARNSVLGLTAAGHLLAAIPPELTLSELWQAAAAIERGGSEPVAEVKIDDTPIDNLTVKFWRDGPCWACHIGPDIAAGVGGFGATPLKALRDLCQNIAKFEGHRTDGGKIFLR